MNRIALVGALLAAAVGSACNPPPPDVLIISIDSLRADQVGAESSGRSLTPNLDAFAQQALVYDHALSAAPWTTPAMMSVMTGLPPAAHGVFDHDRALAEGVPTLAEKFAAAGYRTAAFVPAVTLRQEFGFGRGFEHFDYEEFGHTLLSSPQLVGKVLQTLDQWPDEPSFLWVHLWDPHYNYNPPTPFDRHFLRGQAPPSQQVQCLKWFEDPVTEAEAEYLLGQHEGEVLYTDHYLGELFDTLRENERLDQTIVVVLADHGEAFLEHGWLGHTNRVDHPVIHVPLMIRWPGHVVPEKQTLPVSTAGVGRTLLELAGLKSEGFGSLPAIRPRGEGDWETWPISETRRRGCFTTLVASQHKYVIEHLTCREELYDLVADPQELNDLANSRPEDLKSLRSGLLSRLQASERAAIPWAMFPREGSEETHENLLSLSYLSQSQDGSGDTEDPCARLLSDAGVDAFGDRLSEVRCPNRGALDCLETLSETTD